MAYAFSTSIDPGFEIQDHTMWAALIAACNERLSAIPSYSVTGAHIESSDSFAPPTYTSVANGTNIQSAGWWNNYGPLSAESIFYPMPQTWADTPFPLGMQAAIVYMLPFFVNHTLTYDGSATDPFAGWLAATPLFTPSAVPACVWTMPAIRAAAGLPVTINPFQQANATPNYVPNNGFRRKRPREIAIAGATVDAQNNPAIAGQRAWGPDSRKYYCVAPGNWILDGSNPAIPIGPVDVLDNTLDYPNAITSDSYFSTGYQLSGQLQKGDYIGSWLFEEVRQLVNLLRWRWDIVIPTPQLPNWQGDMTQAGNTSSNYQTHFDSQTSSVSFADLMSKLQAGWLTPTAKSPIASYPSAFWYADGAWGGFGDRTDCTWTLNNLGALTKAVDWYVYAIATTADGGIRAGGTFDAQGDPVLQNTFHLWHSDAGVTAATLVSPKFGDASTFPPNAPADPATAGTNAIGYQVTDAVAISKFAFAYTF